MLKKLGILLILATLPILVLSCSSDKTTTPTKTEYEVIQPALDSYTSGTQAPVITAEALYTNMQDGDATNDYFVVSVRGAAADAYVSTHAPVILAATLYAELNGGDTSNDPQIISVRSATDYAKGHIPGAINIPWKEIAKESNLKKIDPDRDVVVYCYTGHTGGIATTALNMLGYDALNLKWGITSWTKDATVRAQNAFDESVDAHNYPVTAGANP